jgi:hypothetical protein
VSVDQAVTAAFGIHAFQYVTVCLLGLVGLARESLSLSWLRARASARGGDDVISASASASDVPSTDVPSAPSVEASLEAGETK